MTDKADQPKEKPSASKLDDFLITEYEMRNMSEIIRDWLPGWLPRRKKKRKRD